MTAPIGLTRAELDLEQRSTGPRVAVVASPDATRCRASVPPNGDGCVAAARYRVVWQGAESENPPTAMCPDCALRTQQLAQSHRTSVGLEPL